MLNNYITYLLFINSKLKKFFEKQKPYIFCKKGCGLCCQNAQFPYSKIEIDYLMIGICQLDLETKKIISQNIKKIQKQKSEFNGDIFKYDCPFLINNECSIYEYRGIICRSFGLLNVGNDEKIKVPFCCFQGLNYSNVLKNGENKISEEKFKNLNIKEEPVAFHTNYDFLTNSDFERGFNFKFGEKRPIIEWFTEYKINEQYTNNIQINDI